LQKVNLFPIPKSSFKSNKDNYFRPQKILDNQINSYNREREREGEQTHYTTKHQQRTTLTQNTLTEKHCPIDKKTPTAIMLDQKNRHVLEKRVPCWTINSPVHTRGKKNRGNPETVTGFILAQNSKTNSGAVRRIRKVKQM